MNARHGVIAGGLLSFSVRSVGGVVGRKRDVWKEVAGCCACELRGVLKLLRRRMLFHLFSFTVSLLFSSLLSLYLFIISNI